MNTNAMERFEERGFDSVICPKPRRLSVFSSSTHHDHIRTDLLDILPTKGGYWAAKPTEQYGYMASSPPYFCGSPPSRTANPVIQDDRFNKEKPSLPPLTSPAPPYSSSTRGGCMRVKFGQKPAAVLIEGFDCLTRDGRNRSISAVA